MFRRSRLTEYGSSPVWQRDSCAWMEFPGVNRPGLSSNAPDGSVDVGSCSAENLLLRRDVA